MTKNIVIAILGAAVVFFCASIVHIENQRYALQNDMCRGGPDDILVDFACLEKVQTRTSWTPGISIRADGLKPSLSGIRPRTDITRQISADLSTGNSL